jgi:predicted molibdopterin-dependent oxidoreductase YjgC
MELWVKDNKIVRVYGCEDAPDNKGALCVKGRFGLDFVNHPDRLTKPLIKRDGKFEEAGWDEALDLVAGKFKELKENYGGDALAGLSSAKCTNEENYLFQKFIRACFGTNSVDHCARL